MRNINIIVVIFFNIYISAVSDCHAEEYSPASFSIKTKKEVFILLTCLSSHLAGDHFISNMTVPDPVTLDKNDINSFDRFACEYYSKKLSKISNNTKDATTILLTLSMLPHLENIKHGKVTELLSDVVMYLETQSLSVGLAKCSKGLSSRPRPYVYNNDVPLAIRQNTGSFESFWSGHASLAFSTAVFTGYVFQNRNPGSRFIMPVWITGIGCATATSILRVSSGNHFPSDVITGSAIGSLIGWLVPRMHKIKYESFSVNTMVDGNPGLGITFFIGRKL